MLTVRIAELTIGIHHTYAETEHLLDAYRVTDLQPDFTVCALPEAIRSEQEHAQQPCSAGYAETVCIHREIARKLPFYNALLMHAAVLSFDGKAYAFAAPSGTGKSTHLSLWKKAFGDAVQVINGDKPVLRLKDGCFYAYGTPWAGKEGWQQNTCAPLAGLCFLNRGDTNEIRRITPQQALPLSLGQILLPRDAQTTDRTLLLLDQTLRSVPLWSLSCTPDVQAAMVAKRAMCGGIA